MQVLRVGYQGLWLLVKRLTVVVLEMLSICNTKEEQSYEKGFWGPVCKLVWHGKARALIGSWPELRGHTTSNPSKVIPVEVVSVIAGASEAPVSAAAAPRVRATVISAGGSDSDTSASVFRSKQMYLNNFHIIVSKHVIYVRVRKTAIHVSLSNKVLSNKT